jgi:hypothetical protein
MGGFILALGIESSGLHKRLALKMLIAIGNSGAKLVGGFMLVSASDKYVGDEYINHIDASANWFGCMLRVLQKLFLNFLSKRKKTL